jgi:hypothetical protein
MKPKRRRKGLELDRDARLKAQALRDANHTYADIAHQLGCTWRQAEYACKNRPTPQHHKSGRKPFLDDAETDVCVHVMLKK